MISAKISGILKCSVFLKIRKIFFLLKVHSLWILTLQSLVLGFREDFKNSCNFVNLNPSSDSLLNGSLQYFINIFYFRWSLGGVSDSLVAKLVVALLYACFLYYCCPHTKSVFIQMCHLVWVKLVAQGGLYCFLSKSKDIHLKI